MKTLSISAPDADFDQTVEALCLKGNWLQNGDLENGNKVDFAQGVLLDWLGECRRAYAASIHMKQVQDLQAQIQAAIEAGNVAAREAVVLEIK